MNLTGGYLTHRRPLIRATHNKHTAVLDKPISQLDLDAINAVQATPWRVNTWVLDVMEEAWITERRLGGLEVGVPLPRPLKLPDGEWAALNADERRAKVAERAAVYKENARIRSRSSAVLDALSVAEELRDKPAIYFPHNKDFRGRIYPAATFGPHPQGSDISRALLMFAEGVPLGTSGLYWLMIRAANTMGKGDPAQPDKLPLEERIAWTLGHMTQIGASATDPLHTDWWTNADEPWSFLATCYELATAYSLSEPATFQSHLPIPLDGSCNGLQHLAAMGLDPIGAKATNLTNDTPRDIYEEVAARVRELVDEDARAGLPEALLWQGKIDRYTVKRGVMTTPYGVTGAGIRKQLIDGRLVPKGHDIGIGATAEYMRDKLVIALGDTVQSARAVMSWLQGTAERLARAGYPLRWTTPSGSTVQQAYRSVRRIDLRTLVGQVILFEEEQGSSTNIKKQALGSAPNVIHSFDAAHLAMTVDAGVKDGITSWAMIHDSYATHAGNTNRLARILREQFVCIYRDDWLQRIKDEIATYAPSVQVDDPPARGTFDIESVLDAPYFFS